MDTPNIPPPETFFRYNIVSQVLSRELKGQPRSEAIEAVADITHISPERRLCQIHKRSIYRWLAAYETHGFKGLMPKERIKDRYSDVLPASLLEFFKNQKTMDPQASIPELIKRANMLTLEGCQKAHRVTVWRCLNRMGVDTTPRKSIKNRDARRFAYPHRMDMMICDGKHFRAGIGRLRRVAFFFLDDATRKGLDVVVGTSENAHLFLRGLYRVFLNYGLPTAMYLDKGPGFKANDVIILAGKLDILLIHGQGAYPEGHGKIEKFNQTAKAQVLRYLDNNPEIDPACSALELRLRHYLFEQYNHNPHESLEEQTPWNRFHNDPKALTFKKSREQLRQAFILHESRRVSFDNVIPFDGVGYDVPRGYAGARIVLHRNLLDKSLSIIDQGRLVKLSPVDLHTNARSKRSKPKNQKEDLHRQLPKSSAQMAFERDFKPVVDADGNVHIPHKEDQS